MMMHLPMAAINEGITSGMMMHLPMAAINEGITSGMMMHLPMAAINEGITSGMMMHLPMAAINEGITSGMMMHLPMAAINEGITSGMMMHFSMLRKRWPMYPTYMASLYKIKLHYYSQLIKYGINTLSNFHRALYDHAVYFKQFWGSGFREDRSLSYLITCCWCSYNDGGFLGLLIHYIIQ
jgi:hypothetical protein